ncbi:uncharacterized protein DUF4149 [Paucimonas lemoignei]|uniref:Uncharacterized protein DUF4149 n=1 Tax=Paucimonas lemoignei TaxID=29443 RepID=A0A4V2UJC7_PAULE|nr:DUF4149 domain-containing protein [Paucimonas lemoignei]TCS39650.1 uncharacterized protein DUF4149 [Paucimonas lemoignei]
MVEARARVVLATLWVGSLWTIGYIVAPTLFATLEDRGLAGTLAGRMFQVEAWITIACAVMLAILVMRAGEAYESLQRKHLLIVIVLMLLCTVISHFGIQPFMAELRASVPAGGVMNAETAARFGKLHGASSGIYLVQSMLGLVLVLKLFRVK